METNYHTQRTKGERSPERRDNPTVKSSIPVDKGLDKVFRGNRFREETTKQDGETGKDGQ